MSRDVKGKGGLQDLTTEKFKKVRAGIQSLYDMSLCQLIDYQIGLQLYYPQLKGHIEDVVEHIQRKRKYPNRIYLGQKPKPSNSNQQTNEKKWGLSFFKSLPLVKRLFTQEVDSQPQEKPGSNGYHLLKQQQQGQGKKIESGDRLGECKEPKSSKAQSKQKDD